MATKKPPAVYSYVRFSSELQRKGTGQRRQDDRADAYCANEKRNWTLTKNYSDLAVSAWKSKNATHGELAVFLRAVDEGRIAPGSVLLVESLDRLSRDNINKALQMFLGIINAGIIVITLCDEQEYRADSDPAQLMAKMMISLAYFLRANDESRMKSQRKAASWSYKREAARKGAYHGGRLPAWIGLDANQKYVVIEEEAVRPREFFRRYVAGDGLYILARHFKVNKSTLAYWLDGKIVLGTLTVTEEGRKVEYPGHYPKIIDPTEWETAQQKKRERLVGRKRGHATFVNLFQGLLFGPDGSTFQIQSNNGPALRTFVAPGCCLQVKQLEKHICWNHLYGRLVEKRTVVSQEPAEAEKLATLEAKIKAIQTEMSADAGLFGDLLPVLNDVRRQRDAIKAKSHRVVSESADPWTVDNCLMSHGDDHDREGRARLREMIRDTVKRIDIDSVEGQRRRLVTGRIHLHDGSSRAMRYAFDVRCHGVVPCDGTGDDPRLSNLLGDAESVLPLPLNTTTIDSGVLAELDKLNRNRIAKAEREATRIAKVVKPEKRRRKKAA